MSEQSRNAQVCAARKAQTMLGKKPEQVYYKNTKKRQFLPFWKLPSVKAILLSLKPFVPVEFHRLPFLLNGIFKLFSNAKNESLR